MGIANPFKLPRRFVSTEMFFLSSRCSKTDISALKTADSGLLLTRRLVNAAQDVIIREDDCEQTVVSVSSLSQKERSISISKISMVVTLRKLLNIQKLVQ